MTSRAWVLGATPLALTAAGSAWAGWTLANVHSARIAARAGCCCDDPTCPPGCTPECAAECLAAADANGAE
jgi:hypothetical protein